MFSKKIKPLAIVPDELYVIRQADLQLKQIIADMGRPGYVLVSRQMGKTNLLLNAKREFDSNEDCFSYLDVSNTFLDLRSFFRNIIDTTILTKDELTGPLLAKIGLSRQGTINLSPHKEHEFELKTILDDLPGKLVICLDEIDALTNVDYSDNVFSLIRSIYFSGRTHYPQFKRLTYVLSGVADPAELIKNKAISPFNIGEKIYLDDFTLAETEQFLSQCKLSFPLGVIERIYYWTSGNPRVTWDLCSAAENALHDGHVLDHGYIDRLVSKLYLKNHDLPPFDHIRTRVQVDKELRNSIMAIHYGKSSSLSDKVKDRLYLSGISTPKQESGEIFFKNRIMAESLSEKWVSDIESELLTIDERASEKIKLKRYDEAIALFKELLLESTSATDRMAAKLNIAYCLVQLNDINSAIDEYESCVVEGVENEALLNVKRHWSGICYMFSNRFSDADFQFREILKSNTEGKKILFYAEACINLASLWLAETQGDAAGVGKTNPEVEQLLKKAISLVPKDASNRLASDNEILYTAYYQLSKYCSITDQSELRKEYLELALEVGDPVVISTLLYERASFEEDSSERAAYYVRCAKNIIDFRAPLLGSDIMNQLKFGAGECSALVHELVRVGKFDEAKELFEYVASIETNENAISSGIIAFSVSACLRDSEFSLVPDFARLAVLSKTISKEGLRQVLTLGMLVTSQEEDSKASDLSEFYTNFYLRKEGSSLAESDFRIIYDIFFSFFLRDQYDKCSELLSLVDKAFELAYAKDELAKDVLKNGALILLFLRFRLGAEQHDFSGIHESLAPYIPYIRNLNKFSLTYFPDGYAKILDRGFRSVIEEDFYDMDVAEKSPFRAGSKIGRNDTVKVQYLNGNVKQGKYKKFLSDINNNQCFIIV